MQLRDIRARTIAIRLPNWVGDAVMATPAVRALREAAPEARILAVARPAVIELLGGLPHVDDFVSLDRGGAHAGLGGLLRFGRELRTESVDVGVLLPHSFSSALQFRLGRVRCVVGYWSRERSLLLHVAPRPPMEQGQRIPEPMTRHYLRLVQEIGGDHHNESLELAVSAAEEDEFRQLRPRLGLEEGEAYFVASPGASFGSSKQWTTEGFAETLRGLRQRYGLRTLVQGGPGEEALVREIVQSVPEAAIDGSREPIRLSLLKPLLRDARLLITTDTGPRHIATAFDVPSVVLMGPTDPRYTASNLEHTRVLRVEVDCGPCHLKICPLDHRCMTRLTADDALQAAAELLDRSAEGRREVLHV